MRYLSLISRLGRVVSSCGLLCAVTLASAQNPGGAATGPRHVILIIGDGMGEQQVTIARNYLAGARGHLLQDELPVRATVQVLGVEDTVDAPPVYVTDSANTATAIATGQVTSRGRIGTGPGNERPLTNIVSLARQAGFRTGIVTTASVTDATPAAFVAHINFRRCENPSQMSGVVFQNIYLGECSRHLKANGGAGSITEQLVVSGLDVLLGGGSKHFEYRTEPDGPSLRQQAVTAGFNVVTSAGMLAGAKPPQRLLGLFAPGTLPVRLQGSDGRRAEKPEPSLLNRVNDYFGGVKLPDPMTCEPNPAHRQVPSLKAMTEAALTHLAHDSPRGFFLMVESASIDKQAHERNPCGSIGEVQQLQEALASALAFARREPQTLILVTADHAHAAQLVPETSHFAVFPVPIYTPGHMARIITPEGGLMGVNYATNSFLYEEHTGASVPLYANAEASGLVPSFIQQPDLFRIMGDYLQLPATRESAPTSP